MRLLLVAVIMLSGSACSNMDTMEKDSMGTRYGIEMVYVKGGTFMMGCTPEQESVCDDREKPAYEATLSDFYIGKYEVTQKLWRQIMGTDLFQQFDAAAGIEAPLSGNSDDDPMYYVSWEDALEFIERLNEATGKSYRLPTEAEWEYAARGGGQSRGYKYSGSNNAGDVAWFSDNSKSVAHPVGTKGANELGIHDMSGNVNEWVYDWYGDYDDTPQTNPSGPESGKYPYRVFRGGSWFNGAWYARVSYRNGGGARTEETGFRLALSPE